MFLTKKDLVKSLHNNHGLGKNTSLIIIESLLEIIKSTLVSGEDVLISGFGKFTVNDKNERRGRNPNTGDELMLNARRTVTLKCSNILRKKMK